MAFGADADMSDAATTPSKDQVAGGFDLIDAHNPKAPEPAHEVASLQRSRILRKLDLRILPMMLITYGLQFLDKALLGYAAVYSMREDTHLHGQQYSWIGSIFYFGYMVFEYPLASFLRYFPSSLYLGFFIVVWGICVMMTNFCTNFAGLMVNRFVLGALESVVAPSFVVITAQWYTREEQPIRQVIWFAGTPLFGIFGGLLGYAFGFTHTAVASWRLLYIVFGSVTTIFGIFFALFFPSSPDKASFLTEDERTYITMMSQDGHNSFESKWKWSQVIEACLDIKTYLFFVIGIANTIPSGSLSNFSSLLIKGFGFTDVQTQLIGIPSHIVQITSLLVSGLIATKTRNLSLIIMSLCVVPSILGTALVYVLPSTNQWGRVVAVWIIYTNSASLAVSFSVISGNVAGFTKRTTVTFLLFIGYCVGNLIAPQFFLKSEEKEGYPTAIIAMIISFSLLFVIPLALRYLYYAENKRRDLLAEEDGAELNERDNIDMTDIQDRSFRYAL
ncbi:hypothetical protein LT330_005123 [Penicillium expansum]|nr:hypothetical protein LT330_005123 [Penicillium expansum]